tara:strand:+ start:294 stop:422 length:129 start_codon:yes stop_codon:yes gene_type:complete
MNDDRHIYECTDCNEMFYADEPSEGRDICDRCREEYRNMEGK